jgi:transcriptional regulator with XRE-family HTH domain
VASAAGQYIAAGELAVQTINMTIGRRWKLRRVAVDLRQQDIADGIGISTTRYSALERGQEVPTELERSLIERLLPELPAGASDKDLQRVEAESAFDLACDYLREHGVDLLPTYCKGRLVPPPPLPPRIDYALRRIGGLRGLNELTEDSRPSLRRDFIEAYKDAPLAEQMRPTLQKILRSLDSASRDENSSVKVDPAKSTHSDPSLRNK